MNSVVVTLRELEPTSREPEGEKNFSTTILAMGFTVAGCFLNALSLILMKYSMEVKIPNEVQEMPPVDIEKTCDANAEPEAKNQQQHSIMNKYWISGFVCVIFGTIANILAIRFGDLLLLASSSALTMIFNTILSVYILGESFTKWDVIAIFLICSGSISCMIFSKTSNQQLSQQELYGLYTSLGSLTYLILSALFIISVYRFDISIRSKVSSGWEQIVKVWNDQELKKAEQRILNSKSKKFESSSEKSLMQSESDKLQCNKTSIKQASTGKISESGVSGAQSEVDVNQIGVSLNKYTAGFEAGRKLKIML